MVIERMWNQEPGWFFAQPKATQTMLFADFRLALETPDQANRATKRVRRRRLDVGREQYMKDHGYTNGS